MTDLIAQPDNVATIDAYEGGKIHVTILSDATKRHLSGKLVEIDIDAEDEHQRILARINRVDMMNPVHKRDDFKSAIAAFGKIEYYSKDCDILSAAVEIIACIRASDKSFSAISCPPSSGTLVRMIHDKDIADYQVDKEYNAVIGHLPDEPKMPMSIINRHFGDYDIGGFGEAKHTCIFGQNGSGKTVMALTMLAAQLAANPQMGCLVPDTAGDISKGGSHSKGEFKFDFIDLLESAHRTPEYIKIDDIKLTSKGTFKKLLEGVLTDLLNTRGENATKLADDVTEILFRDIKGKPLSKVDMTKASVDKVLDAICLQVTNAYSDASKKGKQAEADRLKTERRSRFERTYNDRVVQFFEGTHDIDSLIDGFLDKGRIILINMATMSEPDQAIVMYEIFTKVRTKSNKEFKISGKTRNAIIVLDEGARWAPEGGENEITEAIIDSYNTTRKLGVGWMIISQRITSVSKKIIAQCHTKLCGRGLGVGADANHLESFFGNDGLNTYRQLSLRGGYFWLATGHLVNYGQGDQYLAFDTFTGDSTEAIKNANPDIWNDHNY